MFGVKLVTGTVWGEESMVSRERSCSYQHTKASAVAGTEKLPGQAERLLRLEK